LTDAAVSQEADGERFKIIENEKILEFNMRSPAKKEGFETPSELL
jgi:hypothetical protein